MAVKLAPLGDTRVQFFDSQGNVLNGGKVFFYLAGTTTKHDTFTTYTGGVANSNPIVLDSDGRTPHGVWFDDQLAYQVVLAPANDTDPPTSPIWTEDQVYGINITSAQSTLTEWVDLGYTETRLSATQFSVPGDHTTDYDNGRRIKALDGVSTFYGYVSAASFGAGITTVTVVLDSGALTAALSNVFVSVLNSDNSSMPWLKSSTTGLTLTGTLTLAADPASALQAATKQYVDGLVVGRLISDTVYGISAHTVTMTIATPCVVTFSALSSSLFEGMPVVFTSSGALPTGIVSGTTYYITAPVTNSTSNLSATRGGAKINTSGGQSGVHTASNPTYNKATNSPTYVEIEMVSGGGGGGGVAATAGATGGGGGGGGWSCFSGPATSIIAGAVTLNVGIGGAAGASGGGAGGAGGVTSAIIFTGSVTMTLTGGGGGSFGAASTPAQGGLGGFPTTTTYTGIAGTFVSQIGGPGGYSISTAAAATSYSGIGGSSKYGGGAVSTAIGATSPGRDAYNPTGGSNQPNPGAGGSGATGATAGAGGAGAPGMIRIREYS